MQFKDLIKNIENIEIVGNFDIDITGLEADSRKVEAGFLFAALKGVALDGTQFIEQAINSGARAILVAADYAGEMPTDVSWIKSAEPRKVLAFLAANFYPNQPPKILAITGTNGKSSIVDFLRQIFAKAGKRAASLGTLGVQICEDGQPDEHIELHHTSPDPISLHRILHQLAAKNVEFLGIEASSHGLVQNRIDGVKICAAGFTNLTLDHLDYHENMEDYFEAKMRLFTELLPKTSQAVVSADGSYSKRVANIAGFAGSNAKCVGFAGDYIKLNKVTNLQNGQRMNFDLLGKNYEIDLPLIGVFQVENALVAAGLALSQPDINVDLVMQALKQLKGAKGRLELVGQNQTGGRIFVDFAHTNDSLENAILALRPYLGTDSKLVVIFGCGGDRDQSKRPLMGAVAEKNAEIAILTDDNPRFEDPASIRAMAKQGCPSALEIGDRRAAIAKGIALLDAGDILLVAGKGHETGQKIMGKEYEFSDQIEILKLLKAENE
ncbi:MAG: UDP-N-acetylmuramoyl-L-alanyl-D-glutamate--2,6-diaminopimelate ligase [Rhizobiales bacterium]|nr:UDP-N-acetylmuramoyl-L-alanyl-D-glutamate--2,6-diaminopimelate ligase [Hyphomicrobiales bacterium]NRB14000.1 UDP-N-acetylmuramoyl-L-alanyl-D-glutamate--2,6-diaminopimelate ligase [Hyphomicrobiales bacterium]